MCVVRLNLNSYPCANTWHHTPLYSGWKCGRMWIDPEPTHDYKLITFWYLITYGKGNLLHCHFVIEKLLLTSPVPLSLQHNGILFANSQIIITARASGKDCLSKQLKYTYYFYARPATPTRINIRYKIFSTPPLFGLFLCVSLILVSKRPTTTKPTLYWPWQREQPPSPQFSNIQKQQKNKFKGE